MKTKISCNRHTLDRLKLLILSVINLHFLSIYLFAPLFFVTKNFTHCNTF